MPTGIPVAEFRETLSDKLSLAQFVGTRTKISRSGKLCAGLVPPRDIDFLESIEELIQNQKCTKLRDEQKCTFVSECTCILGILEVLNKRFA